MRARVGITVIEWYNITEHWLSGEFSSTDDVRAYSMKRTPFIPDRKKKQNCTFIDM
jgi:hypothetical protein